MSQTNAHKMSPEYWGGYDIYDESLFLNAPASTDTYLEYKSLVQAREWLHYGVGQVAAGNSTEIRYRMGNKFNPDIANGSLVILDTEYLGRWTYPDPEHTFEDPKPKDKSLAISRPFSDYWLKHQDGAIQPITDLGSESVTFSKETAIYNRLLHWGVVTEEGDTRYIKPFFFGVTKLLPGGSVYSPRITRRWVQIAGIAMPMPIEIGQVTVNPRVGNEKFALDSLKRVRSIDVVYPAKGNTNPQRVKGRKLAKLALPKLQPKPALDH